MEHSSALDLSNSALLRLPLELRNAIYIELFQNFEYPASRQTPHHHHYVEDSVVKRHAPEHESPSIMTAILGVCRQIRQEALVHFQSLVTLTVGFLANFKHSSRTNRTEIYRIPGAFDTNRLQRLVFRTCRTGNKDVDNSKLRSMFAKRKLDQLLPRLNEFTLVNNEREAIWPDFKCCGQDVTRDLIRSLDTPESRAELTEEIASRMYRVWGSARYSWTLTMGDFLSNPTRVKFRYLRQHWRIARVWRRGPRPLSLAPAIDGVRTECTLPSGPGCLLTQCSYPTVNQLYETWRLRFFHFEIRRPRVLEYQFHGCPFI